MSDSRNIRRRTIRCVIGHDIAEGDIDRLTRAEMMDGDAEVRICVEHGAPLALIVEPADESISPQ